MRTLFVLLCAAVMAAAQTLPLPARAAASPTGSQLRNTLVPLARAAREDTLFRHITAGNVPQFLRSLKTITTSRTINGTLYTLEYYVTPDYLSVGSDSDHTLMPMTPLLAQRLANALHCTLPTPRMVDQIYAAAPLKLAPQPIPPDLVMDQVPRFYEHNDSVRALRVPKLGAYPLGTLIGGTKKDVVIDKKVYSWIKSTVPKPVVIYGWHQLNGVPIQPTYNGHGETYADYSHGIRLVQRYGKINGAQIDLIDILTDPVYSPLLSDTTLVKPYYGSLTKAEESSLEPPRNFRLEQNFPNPFNPGTTISFSVSPLSGRSATERVQLKVYNILGEEVSTLVDDELAAGTYSVRFTDAASELSSGVYFYRLQTPVASQTNRMVLLR